MSLSETKSSAGSKLSFEQGPIRPPSEARSLLIRVTRNCPWNKCTFCNTYKGTQFSIRSAEEIKADIVAIKKICEEIKALSWRLGLQGVVDDEVIDHIYRGTRAHSSSYLNVATWLYFGEGSVFLQDGNNLAARTQDLAEVLTFLSNNVPGITRVTTYARSKTIARRKTARELRMLREAGLMRIHIGLESGSNQVLELLQKGVSAAEHIEAGRKVKEAGISLSEYVIPGAGGRKLSEEHARETAKVLSQVNPDYIRLRTLRVIPGAGLDEKVASGEFESLGDEDVVREIRLMIEGLEGIDSVVVSDHILNLLEEVEGKLPEEKPRMLAVIDRFLALAPEERCNFRLGRRANIYRTLDDMEDPARYAAVARALRQITEPGGQGLEEVICALMSKYI